MTISEENFNCYGKPLKRRFRMNRYSFLTMVAIATVFVLVNSIVAQTCPGFAGCLDTTFGSGGSVAASVNNGVASGWAAAVAV
jgi:hypothetical protein